MIDLHTFKTQLSNLQTLNDRFAIQHFVTFKADRYGAPTVEITNDQAVATVALQGGQVLTFRPRDQDPVLWVSPFAPVDKAKPIRGGVPICWPWFGPHETDKAKPVHGFVRTRNWEVVGTEQLNTGETVLKLAFVPTTETQAIWNFPVELQLVIQVGTDLKVNLLTRNLGIQSLLISEGFHTYFKVSDVREIAVEGLEGTEYVDKVDQGHKKIQSGAVKITQETDRVYLHTSVDTLIDDPKLGRKIRIVKTGSLSTVVWNPWEEKGAQLGDAGYQGYLGMLCVEVANALDNQVTIPAGIQHDLGMRISLDSK